MKSAGVFLGGLTSVMACNLMLVGVCSSAPSLTPPAALPPPPVPAPIVRVIEKSAPPLEPIPWGMFIWGCGGRIAVDAEAALALPICFNPGR